MGEIWEQYVNKTEKEVLTSEKLRHELGDERKSVVAGVIIAVVILFFTIGLLAILGLWMNIPLLLTGLFKGVKASYQTLQLFVLIICYLAICCYGIRYFIRLYKAKDSGMKLVSARVCGMRSADVYRRHAIGTYEDRNITYYYLTFKVYGEVCLQGYDYEFTDHPMAAGDVYFSTSVGDEFYLVSFKNNGDVIKAFPAKYFELSDECVYPGGFDGPHQNDGDPFGRLFTGFCTLDFAVDRRSRTDCCVPVGKYHHCSRVGILHKAYRDRDFGLPVLSGNNLRCYG